jgi:hypothetical protein
VDQTPKEAFDAFNNVRRRWSEEIEGSSEKPGDEFAFCHNEIHCSEQKLIDLFLARKRFGLPRTPL